jgi:uncharacterized protein YcfL
MRSSIMIVLACLALAACGSSHKTVVVNPPPDSTTVVNGNGDTHVIERD